MTIVSDILEEILFTTFTALSSVHTVLDFHLFQLAAVTGLTGLTGLVAFDAAALTAVTAGSRYISDVTGVGGTVHQQWVELRAVVLCAEGIWYHRNPTLMHSSKQSRVSLGFH